jgi:transcriptional regulator with XRE-family HTH domain
MSEGLLDRPGHVVRTVTTSLKEAPDMAKRARRPRNPDLFDLAAGRRMIDLFERARVELGFETDADLWRHLGVSRDTAQSWMRGERPPSRDAGPRVAERLGITYANLLDSYYGREPEMDTATVIAALEWAIRQVRAGSGSVPPEVRQAVEQVAGRSKARRQTRQKV